MIETIPNNNNVLSFNGPLTMHFISITANYLHEAINTNQVTHKKVFKVFVELVQNVAFYSAETRNSLRDPDSRRGVGSFSIDEFEEYFLVTTGNMILKEHVQILKKNCDEINTCNKDELRELKRNTRRYAVAKDVGAHIGLIYVGLLSGSPLDISFKKTGEEHFYFRIKVKVNKNINN